MQTSQMLGVLDALSAKGIRHWVVGGFGIALLTGRVSREHRDLDLLIDATQLDDAMNLLQEGGYSVETDWLPARVELARADDNWVDLHPVVMAADGSGRQAGPDETWFDYLPSDFTVAHFEQRAIPCFTAAAQQRFHTGYPLRTKDIHDLAELRSINDQER